MCNSWEIGIKHVLRTIWSDLNFRPASTMIYYAQHFWVRCSITICRLLTCMSAPENRLSDSGRDWCFFIVAPMATFCRPRLGGFPRTRIHFRLMCLEEEHPQSRQLECTILSVQMWMLPGRYAVLGSLIRQLPVWKHPPSFSSAMNSSQPLNGRN